MTFDKNEIKNNLTIEQVEDLLGELGAEPQKYNDETLTCKTICHGGESHKLYYYDNTKLFHCFTECSESFDIFDLVLKVKRLAGEQAPHYENGEEKWGEYQLNHAIYFIAQYYGFAPQTENFSEKQLDLDDFKIFQKYEQSLNKRQYKKEIEIKKYDDSFLKNYPRPIIASWEQEGISKKIMDKRGICYDPVQHSILIPHNNVNGDCVGIRRRTLIKEQEEKYGKYKPAIINKIQYNHPLNFNLYNLNNSKKAIGVIHKAIVFEGEKSPLLYATYFGEENDISVACCGSTFSSYQFYLLKAAGADEIIIAFDKQFKKLGDKEWEGWVKKMKTFAKKYGNETNLSFIFDTEDLLPYKASPIDCGPEIFLQLFNNRLDKNGRE